MGVDVVRMQIGGVVLETWDSYDLDSELLTPADSWSFTAPVVGSVASREGLRASIEENWSSVEVTLSRDGSDDARCVQLTGVVDDVAFSDDRNEAGTLRIMGRDRAAALVSSSADLSLGFDEETYFAQAIQDVVRPYGIDVVTESAPARLLATGQTVRLDRPRVLRAYARSMGLDVEAVSMAAGRRTARSGNATLDASSTSDRARERARRGHAAGMTGSDVERLRVSDARPQVGETVWDFIDRHCRRFGVLPWMNARGQLVISSPDYDQAPLFTLRRSLRPGDRTNNILSGGWVTKYGQRASEVTVYGRTRSPDATRSPFHATVAADDVPFHRPMVIHDNSVRSEEEAERRARRELARQRQDALVLEYQVQGHGQGASIYAVDTVVEVQDEATAREGLFYIVGRRFTKDRAKGTITTLRLVPVGSIAL